MTNLDRNGAEEGMKMLRITSRGVNRGDEMFQETGQFVNTTWRKAWHGRKKALGVILNLRSIPIPGSVLVNLGKVVVHPHEEGFTFQEDHVAGVAA